MFEGKTENAPNAIKYNLNHMQTIGCQTYDNK